MKITIDLILVIISVIFLVGSGIYIFYYFTHLNDHQPKKENFSSENNYSGANFNAEYKFDGKYKKNGGLGKIIFLALIFLIYLYFTYYQDGFNYNSYNQNGFVDPTDISLSNLTLFGGAASSLSVYTSMSSGINNSYRRNSYRRSSNRKREKNRRTPYRRNRIKGKGKSFRSRSYGGGK